MGIRGTECTFLFLVALISGLTGNDEVVHRAKRFIEYGPDIAGPYCETRRGGCCPGRIDDCSVPILDTLCYCDRFCNRTRSDCCPDYFSFCFGQERSTPAPLRGKASRRKIEEIFVRITGVHVFVQK